MDAINIQVDDKKILRALRELKRRGTDLAEPMQRISAVMLSSVQQNFRDEGRPEKWQGLAPSTIKQREKEGKWPGMILQKSQAGLLQSIQADSDSTSAEVGTNKLFPDSDKSAGAIHHFGGQAGRGLQVTIPARPFLVLQEDDKADILEIVRGRIEGAVRF
jgi:phage virion morphogenesis protein